ncbi:AGAP005355-PA-like protein [Anopheles sinensis]|uniref:AGAP005355-PA-like protein n=1 Tax=Anopheles sinensis TaxID=74873 RepID=A0A084WEY0_ANOSI|nr:AGAP005355-PA-like protein [Anopheles sinensis]
MRWIIWRRQSCYRYQLTVIDILVDYIRFRCETLTARQPPTAPSVLLHECNRIVANLFAIFDGSVEPVTLTLLRTPPEPRYTMLLYPVFEAILTDRSVRRCGGTVGTIPSYVRMLLCFKRWRSLAIGRTDKAVIDAQAGHFLPARCPTILTASDVPLLRLLPSVPAAQRVNETRYLMANDLFSLDRCVAQFFRHHRRMSPVAADERQLSGIAPRPATTMANRLVSE